MGELKNQIVAVVVGLGTLSLLVGCANTEFQPSDDTGAGIRYYRPRPYVVVLEPFPVAAEHVLVPGTMRPDGLVMSIDKAARESLASLGVQMPDGAEEHTQAVVKLFLPTAAPSTAAGGARFTSGADAGETVQADSLLSSTQVDQMLQDVLDAGRKVDPQSAPSGGVAAGWIRKGDMTEFRDPVNNLFDIRYLPDFDEDYRLTGNAGLGQASLDAYLTRGWAAHHLGKEVDRRELGQFVFANAQAVLDIARAAGKAALVSSTGGLGAAAVLTSGKPGERSQVEVDVQPVMLQITVIEYAVPGVYPILKQSEMLTIEMDMIVQAPSQIAMVNGARTTISVPATKSRVTFKALPVLGSIQQPASAALPVAYRTQKQLVVAVAGAGGGSKSQVSTEARTLAQELQAEVDLIEGSKQFDIRVTVESGEVHLNVIKPDPSNEAWAPVRREVFLILAKLSPEQQALVHPGEHLREE